MVAWRMFSIHDRTLINDVPGDRVWEVAPHADAVAPLLFFINYVSGHGACIWTYIQLLAELFALSDVSPTGSSEVPWETLEQRLHRCDTFYNYKFVEYSFNAAEFLTRHSIPFEFWRPQVPDGDLVARLCAPSVVLKTKHFGASSNPMCSARAVGLELVPLVVGLKLGALQAFTSAMALVQGAEESQARPHGGAQPLSVPEDSKVWAALQGGYYSPMHQRILTEYARHHLELRVRYRTRAWASAWSPISPDPTAIAVCILGAARTLNRPEVFESIRENVTNSFGPGVRVEHFHLWQLEAGRLAADFLPALSALPPAQACTSCGLPVVRRPNLTACATPSCAPQFADLERCWIAVKSFEQKRSMRFDWILRLRTDLKFHAPFGPIRRFDPQEVHLVFLHRAFGKSRPLNYQDNVALVPRYLAAAYFNVRHEPRMCERMKMRGRRHTCRPFWSKTHIQCECIIDARLERLDVPVSRVSLPLIFEVTRDSKGSVFDQVGFRKAAYEFTPL